MRLSGDANFWASSSSSVSVSTARTGNEKNMTARPNNSDEVYFMKKKSLSRRNNAKVKEGYCNINLSRIYRLSRQAKNKKRQYPAITPCIGKYRRTISSSKPLDT